MGRKSIITEEAKDYIRQHGNTMTDKDLTNEVARLLGRPVAVGTISHARMKLGVRKNKVVEQVHNAP